MYILRANHELRMPRDFVFFVSSSSRSRVEESPRVRAGSAWLLPMETTNTGKAVLNASIFNAM